MDSDFECLSVKETTQYLRGSLFINVDFILSTTNYNYDQAVLLKVIEFVKAALRLVVAWLKKATRVQQYCLQLIRLDPDFYLIDKDVALYKSLIEVMGILKRVFCGCHRCLRFYLLHDLNQEKHPGGQINSGIGHL